MIPVREKSEVVDICVDRCTSSHFLSLLLSKPCSFSTSCAFCKVVSCILSMVHHGLHHLVFGWALPLWKIWVCQLGWQTSQLNGKKHVPVSTKQYWTPRHWHVASLNQRMDAMDALPWSSHRWLQGNNAFSRHHWTIQTSISATFFESLRVWNANRAPCQKMRRTPQKSGAVHHFYMTFASDLPSGKLL